MSQRTMLQMLYPAQQGRLQTQQGSEKKKNPTLHIVCFTSNSQEFAFISGLFITFSTLLWTAESET